MRWSDLFDRDILLVSGKGGAGKSSVAAALAIAALSSGRKVLLAEMEGRGEIARSFGVEDPREREVQLRPGLSILSMTPRQAARDYMHLYLGLDRVAPNLLRSGPLDQLVGVAPGFRDLLIAGKLYELTRERRSNPRDIGRPLYDLVVVDGPPTGQVLAFLEAPGTFADLVRVGRIKGQASAIARMLRERLAVLLVATPEEMAVAETVEAAKGLARLRVHLAAVVANRCAGPVAPRGTGRAFRALRPADVSRVAAGAGLGLSLEESQRLLEAAIEGEARYRQQSKFLGDLEGVEETIGLPEVPAGTQADVVAALAREMSGKAMPAADPLPNDQASPFVTGTSLAGSTATSLASSVDGARIVVVCGSGGVGKTTISAAIGIHLANVRRRTVLLTVDPARRLATALRLEPPAGDRTEISVGRGRRMEAIQLNTQRTFDDLIRRLARKPERRDRILGNPFYRRIADTLSGTHEYMAMEKLYELAEEEDHDLIVIDTPPTRSALSFLEAPKQLTDFLGGRLLRWLLWPSARAGRFTLSVARFGATAFAKTVGKLFGAEVLADTAQFLASFEGMFGDFKERSLRVRALLQDPACAFVVVTTPETAKIEEAALFLDRLAEAGMHAACVVVNRSHMQQATDPFAMDLSSASAAIASLSGGNPEERAVASVLRNGLRAGARARVEAEAVRRFNNVQPDVRVVVARELAGDVHDVRGLRRVAAELFP